MAADNEIGSAILNTSFFDKMLKQVTKRQYKFKQAVSIESTSAWNNYFYRRSQTIRSGGTGSATKGIPPGAAFPKATQDYDRIQTVIQKYGLEEYIPWERMKSADIDFQKRAMIELGEGVTKAVDDEIYLVLTESLNVSTASTAATINVLDLHNSGSPKWDDTSAAIADNLEHAKELMAIPPNNYDTTNTMLFVSPRGARYIKKYITDKGSQWNAVAEKQIMNGRLMNIMGTTIIQSLSVPNSQALMVIPKRCGTWKQLEPLTSQIETKKGKGALIWAYEIGVTELTDPGAVTLIDGILSTYAA